MLTTIVAFVVTLGLVIFVHELGHFAVCKWTGIFVKTFSVGFGPKVLRRRVGETEYALSVVPFGGYVKMAGEGVMEEIQDTGTGDDHQFPIGTEEGDRLAAQRDDAIPETRHFRNRPPWQRLAVVTAGPLANLLLAFLIFTTSILVTGIGYRPYTTVGWVQEDSPAAAAGLRQGDRILSVGGEAVEDWADVESGLIDPSRVDPSQMVPVNITAERDGAVQEFVLTPVFDNGWVLGFDYQDTRVGTVKRAGPAARAGLRPGDVIVALDGHEVHAFGEIATYVHDHSGKEVQLTWLRDGREITRAVVPEEAESFDGEMIGRIFYERAYDTRGISLWQGLEFGANRTWLTIKGIVEAIAQIGEMGMDGIGGPIRVGQVAGEMLRWSFAHLMNFIALFSVNLFLLNLLPIPVLDGGHVIFILYEMIFRRSVHERVQAIATQVGLIVLMLFMILVIVGDMLKALPR